MKTFYLYDWELCKKYRIKRDPNILIIHVLGELKNKRNCIIQYIEENMNLKYSYRMRKDFQNISCELISLLSQLY